MGECQNVKEPPLPKIALTRKTKVLVKQANQAIQLVIEEKTPSISHTNLLQYVTAYITSKKIGKTPKSQRKEVIEGSNLNGRQEKRIRLKP